LKITLKAVKIEAVCRFLQHKSKHNFARLVGFVYICVVFAGYNFSHTRRV